MTPTEIWDFLTEGTRTGHAATTRADGRPHVAPVWFVLDGTPEVFTVLFSTSAGTVKGRNLERDPRISFCVDDPHPNYSFVLIDGSVEIIDDLVQVRELATRCGARYVGPDRAEEYGARNGVEGELGVRLTPSRVIGIRDLAD